MDLAGHHFDERDLIWRAMRAAQPVTTRGCGTYRWVWVMSKFGVGSTVAHALCKEFDMNPDDRVKVR